MSGNSAINQIMKFPPFVGLIHLFQCWTRISEVMGHTRKIYPVLFQSVKFQPDTPLSLPKTSTRGKKREMVNISSGSTKDLAKCEKNLYLCTSLFPPRHKLYLKLQSIYHSPLICTFVIWLITSPHPPRMKLFDACLAVQLVLRNCRFSAFFSLFYNQNLLSSPTCVLMYNLGQ